MLSSAEGCSCPLAVATIDDLQLPYEEDAMKLGHAPWLGPSRMTANIEASSICERIELLAFYLTFHNTHH